MRPMLTAGVRRVSRSWPRLAAAACLALRLLPAAAQTPAADTTPPSIEYGPLYRDVELAQVFPDSKTFPDLVPNEAPSDIVAAYEAARGQPGFDLAAFVAQHFQGPVPPGPTVTPATSQTLPAYIDGLWSVLAQSTPDAPAYATLQPLPAPYVVPGGRFREVYYWDSYFAMLGLEQDGRDDLAAGMLRDFAFEVDRYGHVPNGNRSYYLSRSQPPYLALIVDLIAAHEGEATYVTYRPELEAEYAYWMEGGALLPPGTAFRHAVRTADGALLNRYWDDRAAPRDESYYEDVQTAAATTRPARQVWRDLRAAAESGWDFSSRWLADGQTLATIRTTALLPVDLNALLAHLEQTLSHASLVAGDPAAAARYAALAAARVAAIERLMWDASLGAYSDYLWHEGQPAHVLTAATLYPLFLGIAPAEEGGVVAATVRGRLLMPGGLATTTVTSGQQWDQPNGWAPLQWIAVEGLERYGAPDLAHEIAARWVQKNIDGYIANGKLVEKYDVVNPGSDAGSGGEYATQIGFGWTNGVLLSLAARYPDLGAEVAAAVPAPVVAAAQ